jgi:hypothetical protein
MAESNYITLSEIVRRTNLFNIDKLPQFVTFSNYGESMTGTAVAVNSKIYPSAFICLYIPSLNSTDAIKSFIKEHLVGYYENKLAVGRDAWKNSLSETEKNIKPLDILLETIYKFDNSYSIKYISDIVEQDYNGVWSDFMCSVNLNNASNEYKYTVIKTDATEDKDSLIVRFPADYTTDYPYNWAIKTSDGFFKYIGPAAYNDCKLLLDDEKNKWYDYNTCIKIKVEEAGLNDDYLTFNVLIPLYDRIVDEPANPGESSAHALYLHTDVTCPGTVYESSPDELTEKSETLYNTLVPYGMWFSGAEPVKLQYNTNTATENYIQPTWTLTLSSQFKPFPYSNQFSPATTAETGNTADEISKTELHNTFAQVLSAQNKMMREIDEYNNIIASLKNKIDLLEVSCGTSGETSEWVSETSDNRIKLSDINSESGVVIHSAILPPATTTGAGVMTAKQAASLESAASTADKAWQQSNTNKADIAALAEGFTDLGDFDTEQAVFDALADISICADNKKCVLHAHYSTQGKECNLICVQSLNDWHCRQFIFNRDRFFQRGIIFTDAARTEITGIENWEYAFPDRLSWDNTARKYVPSQFGNRFNAAYTDSIPLADTTTDGLMAYSHVQKLDLAADTADAANITAQAAKKKADDTALELQNTVDAGVVRADAGTDKVTVVFDDWFGDDKEVFTCDIPAATSSTAGVMTAQMANNVENFFNEDGGESRMAADIAANTKAVQTAQEGVATNAAAITAETEARAAADTAETAARKQGDADLLSQIDSTSKTLTAAITNEEQYRSAQDTALQSQITQNKTDITANAAAIAAISKEQLFRDMWTAVGGKWTEAAGYTMNGLTLTYSEAVAVYAQTAGAWKSAAALLENGMYHSLKCRTNIPVSSPISRKMAYFFQSCSGIEVAAIFAMHPVTSVESCFRYCTSLVKVDGALNLQDVTTFANNFYNCPKLTYLRLQGLKVSADLSGAPALDYDSVRYLVDNAVNTAAITVTVGDELYAVINGTAQPTEARGGTAEEWAQLLADATAGQISFAKK